MAKPKTPRKKKPKGGKPGAKPGNQNARTSGIWSKKFVAPKSTKKSEDRLDQMDYIADRLFTLFETEKDFNKSMALVDRIALCVATATGCERQIMLRDGKISSIQDALMRLLAEEDPDDPSTLE